MEALVLDLDQNAQLDVFVPNLLVGAAKVNLGAEMAGDILIRLQTMHKMRLACKTWKTIVDRSIEYNALRLAEYDCIKWPND